MERLRTDADVIGESIDMPARFEAIFDRHFDAIRGYLCRRVGQELADDLAGATFMHAFRARGRYDPERPDARPWLFGIASNLIREHLRHERRQLAAFARTGVDPLAVDQTDRIAEQVDAERTVASALAALSEEERDTVLLYVWGDLSYEEIALTLAIPIGTVRSRLHRARACLRELLVGDRSISGCDG